MAYNKNQYNRALADVETPLGQSKATRLEKGFHVIDDIPMDAIADQYQISPRQVRTGMTRGDQQIKGSSTVVDNNGTVRILMGYDPGGF